MLSLEPLYTDDNTNNANDDDTDADNDDTNNDDNDNDTRRTNHDCIGSMACMPNEPKSRTRAGPFSNRLRATLMFIQFVKHCWVEYTNKSLICISNLMVDITHVILSTEHNPHDAYI